MTTADTHSENVIAQPRAIPTAASREPTESASTCPEHYAGERKGLGTAKSARARVGGYAGLLSVLAGLALWELLSRLVVANSLFLAAPSQIFAAIYDLAVSGELWPHIRISAVEFALWLRACKCPRHRTRHCHGRKRTRLQPWISGLYATPTMALAPLFILWLGIGIRSKALVVIFLVVFPVAINTEAGLRTTSARLRDAAQLRGHATPALPQHTSRASYLPRRRKDGPPKSPSMSSAGMNESSVCRSVAQRGRAKANQRGSARPDTPDSNDAPRYR
jgi:hypothetical protein